MFHWSIWINWFAYRLLSLAGSLWVCVCMWLFVWFCSLSLNVFHRNIFFDAGTHFGKYTWHFVRFFSYGRFVRNLRWNKIAYQNQTVPKSIHYAEYMHTHTHTQAKSYTHAAVKRLPICSYIFIRLFNIYCIWFWTSKTQCVWKKIYAMFNVVIFKANVLNASNGIYEYECMCDWCFGLFFFLSSISLWFRALKYALYMWRNLLFHISLLLLQLQLLRLQRFLRLLRSFLSNIKYSIPMSKWKKEILRNENFFISIDFISSTLVRCLLCCFFFFSIAAMCQLVFFMLKASFFSFVSKIYTFSICSFSLHSLQLFFFLYLEWNKSNYHLCLEGRKKKIVVRKKAPHYMAKFSA